MCAYTRVAVYRFWFIGLWLNFVLAFENTASCAIKLPTLCGKSSSFFRNRTCFFAQLFRKNGRYVSWEERVPLRVEAGKREKRGYLPTGELSVADRILSPPSTAERRRRTVGAQRLNLMTPSPFDREGNARNFSSLENQALFATQKKAANKLFSLTLPLLHTTTSVEK